jgi:hypothetical protein
MEQTSVSNTDPLEASAIKLLHAYVDIRTQAQSNKNAMLYANTALNGGTAPWHVAHVGKEFETARNDFLRLAKAQSAKMLQQAPTSFVQKLETNSHSFNANAYLHQIAEKQGILIEKDKFIIPVGTLEIAA